MIYNLKPWVRNCSLPMIKLRERQIINHLCVCAWFLTAQV